MSSFRYPVEEIRDRCDLVEIVSAHVALRKRGKTLVGLCPFHNEKTPSFHVNPERGAWKCFGCGEGGDVFSFVQKIDNVTFAQAAEQLAQKLGIKIERSEKAAQEISDKERILKANNVACTFFRKTLAASKKAGEYLTRRGVAEATAEKYRLGYAPDSWDELLKHLTEMRVSPADALKAGLIVARESSQGFYDRFRDRLIFPILDTSDRIIAFGGRAMGDFEPKYLNSPETPLFVKNKTLYGLSFARRAVSTLDRAVVVEGYMDAITAQEAGFENTVATMGTALTEEHVNLIARFTKNVVLAFDADSAGMAAALRSWPIFERAGFDIRILSMPRGEDPDSILRGGDRSRFAALLETAVPVTDYRVDVALAGHDMQTEDGRAAALKDAARALADVESAVERERLIKRLAKYHPNFSTGTTLAEDHLRDEVTRFRRRASSRSVSHPTAVGQSVDNAPQPTRGKPISLVERAERLLLGVLIVQTCDAGKVFDALPANEFIGEDTRALAELLSKQFSDMGKIDQERLRDGAAGTPAESLLVDLLVGLEESELNHPVEELINVILNHKKNERRGKLRTLAEKIQEGAIGRGDEEYEEYLRLVRETSSPFRR